MSDRDLIRPLLLLVAAINLATGIAMAFAPGWFFDEVAPYGARSDHFIRDLATYSLATGAVMLVAAERRAWRAPVLAFAVLQYGLHAINHLVDIDETAPASKGILNFIAIGAGAALLAWMARREAVRR